MADISASRYLVRWAASAALALAVGGCAGIPGASTWATLPPMGAAERVLAELQAFVLAEPDDRVRLFTVAVGDLGVEPSPVNRLRVAALQGWPGHANSRPGEATRMLGEMLADDTLDPEVHDLALVLHFWIAQRGTDQRLQRTLRARISALERELEATREQLAALAEIERMMDPEPCPNDDCPQDSDDPAR